MGTIYHIRTLETSTKVLEFFLENWCVVLTEESNISLEDWSLCIASMVEMLAEHYSTSVEDKMDMLKKIHHIIDS